VQKLADLKELEEVMKIVTKGSKRRGNFRITFVSVVVVECLDKIRVV
jgi:hypothetical protein